MTRLEQGDERTVKARNSLRTLAEDAMDVPVRPVTAGKEDGTRVAPSGDPKDYVSLSPYWWPNPDTDDQLPYIRKDGRVNPERHEYDTPKLGDFGTAVRHLGFAYWITGEEKYAERAAEHLRAWFVTPETRMNPRMQYAQFVPGVSDGRAVGIIDTNRLRWVPDAMMMLAGSPHWSASDMAAARQWFGEYMDWLLTSELGQKEQAADNNHGTWFAAQAMLYGLTSGTEEHTERAREIAKTLYERIDRQIDPTGLQPEEAVRTRSLHYHDFNLRGMLDISKYADRIGVDVANFEGEDGSSIRTGIDFLLPYIAGEEEWPYEDIGGRRPYMYYQMLRSAAHVFDEPNYEAAAQRIYPEVREEDLWVDLVMPALPEHLNELGLAQGD